MNYLDLLLASHVWVVVKAAAEFGLLVFAATQVWLQRQDRCARKQAWD